MILIGFVVNVMVFTLYYSLLGLYYGLKRVFWRPKFISQIIFDPNINCNDQDIEIDELQSNKTKTIQNKQATDTNKDFDFPFEKKFKTEIRYLDQPSNEAKTSIPSFRSTLREGMINHDKTGRISRMFSDDVRSVAQSI